MSARAMTSTAVTSPLPRMGTGRGGISGVADSDATATAPGFTLNQLPPLQKGGGGDFSDGGSPAKPANPLLPR